MPLSLAIEGTTMYHYRVENMSCGHCASTITKAISALDHNAQVEIDLAAKSVKVESRQDAEAIRHAIVDAGYPATLL